MRIAIIGLGLIGGSLGLALKQVKWKEAQITGYVRRPWVGHAALNIGAVDKTESSIKETVQHANLVIIATPILTVKDIFTQIAPYLPADCIVTDTSSTKLQVMQWAQELLPPRISFIGGHPMAGKETFGIEAAKPDLFHNCTYCLIKESRATPEAAQTITDMIKSLGATALSIDAQEHDDLVAGISHLPLLLSVALVLATTRNTRWEQMSQLASSGYRDLTRLASGNPEVNAHICLSNKSAIVSWIDDFNKDLQKLRSLILNGDSEIQDALNIASEARRKWQEEHY